MLRCLEVLGTNFCFLSRYRRSMMAGVDHELLLTPEVYPRALATTARHLIKMLVPLIVELMVKAMVSKALAMVPLAMVVKIFLILTLMNETVRCDWVVSFGL
jgi:hypothetical protein